MMTFFFIFAFITVTPIWMFAGLLIADIVKYENWYSSFVKLLLMILGPISLFILLFGLVLHEIYTAITEDNFR